MTENCNSVAAASPSTLVQPLSRIAESRSYNMRASVHVSLRAVMRLVAADEAARTCLHMHGRDAVVQQLRSVNPVMIPAIECRDSHVCGPRVVRPRNTPALMPKCACAKHDAAAASVEGTLLWLNILCIRRVFRQDRHVKTSGYVHDS